jgi:hypothetical protein
MLALYLLAAGVRSGMHGRLFEERLGRVPVVCRVEGLLGVAVMIHVLPGALRDVISQCVSCWYIWLLKLCVCLRENSIASVLEFISLELQEIRWYLVRSHSCSISTCISVPFICVDVMVSDGILRDVTHAAFPCVLAFCVFFPARCRTAFTFHVY